MKILHFVSVMDRGGQETLIMNLMRNIDDSNIKFEFLTTEPQRGDYDDEIESIGGVIHRIDKPKIDRKFFRMYYKNKNIRKTIKSLSNIEDYIFHIHTSHAMDAYMNYKNIRKVANNKIIIHSHNSNAPKKKLHYIFRRMLKNKEIQKMSCSNEATAWMFKDTNDVTFINNAIEFNKFSFDKNVRNSLREEMNLKDKKIILHVGRFNYQKNHKFLIDIFEQIYIKDKSSFLILVGRGELENEIRDLVNEKSLNDSVLFYGVGDNIQDLMSISDLFLLPSLFEGLPVTLVEAQANSLPCLISSTISRQSSISNSLTFEDIDLNPEIWANTALKIINSNKRFSDNNFDKGFDIEHSVKQLKKVYYNKA